MQFIHCVASGDRAVPVDGGSARDLRTRTTATDPSRQLSSLFATDHRPDARARALETSLIFSLEKKKIQTGARAQALALRDLWATRPAGCVRHGALSIRGLSESRVLQSSAATVG